MSIPFLLDKNPLLYQAAWPESGREVRERSFMAACVWQATRVRSCRAVAQIEDFSCTRENSSL